jgi:hypothetical protein
MLRLLADGIHSQLGSTLAELLCVLCLLAFEIPHLFTNNTSKAAPVAAC